MRQTEKVKEMSHLVEKNAIFGSLLQANRHLKAQQNSLVTQVALVDGQMDGAWEKEKEKESDKEKDKVSFSSIFTYLFIHYLLFIIYCYYFSLFVFPLLTPKTGIGSCF